MCPVRGTLCGKLPRPSLLFLELEIVEHCQFVQGRLALALLFLHLLLKALRLLAFRRLLDLLHLDVGFDRLVGFLKQT